jgi:hypothetical protein
MSRFSGPFVVAEVDEVTQQLLLLYTADGLLIAPVALLQRPGAKGTSARQ